MINMFELDVVLLGIDPPITRKVILPVSRPLPYLHCVLQGAMGWNDQHPHAFEIDGTRYEQIDPADPPFSDSVLDEAKHTIGGEIKKNSDIIYEYDFGDSWEHELRLVRRFSVDEFAALPRCVAGSRACPPEDCGGPPGYEELTAILADPSDERHRELKEWAGEWEPEAFSASQATSLIWANLALGLARGVIPRF